jgi:hypothetical protein
MGGSILVYAQRNGDESNQKNPHTGQHMRRVCDWQATCKVSGTPGEGGEKTEEYGEQNELP